MIDAKKIMLKYYDEDSDLFRLLWKHSNQVADLSCEIAKRYKGEVDVEFVREAALLHDIGILETHAPSILCNGDKPYLQHGIIGGEMLRKEGLDRHALVCERHTGAGLTCEEIVAQNLPLPHIDLMPVSVEEKIICYADNFFSKSSPDREKTVDDVRRGMARFGEVQLKRFEEMHEMFG